MLCSYQSVPKWHYDKRPLSIKSAHGSLRDDLHAFIIATPETEINVISKSI